MKRPDITLIDGRRFDLIVVGGGINGAAIARDAALRGLSVLLLERDDFASGTTAWSTRLIHGGLRYLEHREFGLVRESLRERERLLKNAPHLVHSLPLYIPIYRRSKRGPRVIRAGMVLYDILSFDKSLPRHRMLSREAAIEELPGIESDGLRAAACYYDAQATFPERLVIENLVDAAWHGALALNYAGVDDILRHNGAVRGVAFTDTIAGAAYEVEASAVINVAGPWVDAVLGDLSVKRLIGGTKGTHCFVALPEGMTIRPMYAEAKSDGRAIFLLPWNGLLMIGTTDTRYAGEPADAVATPEEVAYLIAEAQALLPNAGFSEDQVLFTYAGIRPLPATKDGAEAGITRRHFVVDHAPAPSGLFSVVGGKLTTHRSLAEHAVDAIAKHLGAGGRCVTADRPMPGAAEAPLSDSRTSDRALKHLDAVYGIHARDIIDIAAGDPALLAPLALNSRAIGAEILYAFREEMATSLADALLRRAMASYVPDLGLSAARAAAAIGRQHLGWSAGDAAAQLTAYEQAVARFRS